MNGREFEYIVIDEAKGADWSNVELVQPKLEKRKGAVATTWTGPKLTRRWPKFVRLGRSVIIFFRNSTWRIGWFVFMAAILSGCSLPCTYQGKAVPKADAERMRALGMDVVCPN